MPAAVKKPVNIKTAKKVTIKNMAWTGKQRKPTVVTIDGKDYTINKTNFSKITYGTNKAIGKGTIKLTGKGKLTGTRTVSFKIVPKKMAAPTATPSGTNAKVGWKKAAANQKVTGYETRYRIKGTSAWQTGPKATASKTSVTIKYLGRAPDGLQYEVQTRAVSGSSPSPWSATRHITTPPTTDDTVIIPNVVDMTIGEVDVVAKAIGFRGVLPSAHAYSANHPRGVVFSQHLPAGAKVSSGDAAAGFLVVYAGSKE